MKTCEEKISAFDPKILEHDTRSLTFFWTYQLLALGLLYAIVRKTEPSLNLIIVYVLLVIKIPIVLYDHFYLEHFGWCKIYADPTNKELFKLFGKSVSHWSVSHFTMWLVITMLCPKYWYWFILIGIFYEGFETVMGMLEYRTLDVGRNFLVENDEGKKKVQYTVWWAYSPFDLLANTLAILLGLFLSQFFAINKTL